MNKSLVTYSIFTFLIIFFFGFKFIFSLLGNFLILLFLIPFLLIGNALLGINFFKTKLKVCENCGALINNDKTCLYCGIKVNRNENNKNYSDDASQEIIEIEAEEIN